MRPLLISVVFIILWIFIGVNLSSLNSPTFDEPIHYQAGINYQKGDYVYDPIEPPLVRRIVVNSSTFFGLPPRFFITIITGLLAACLIFYSAKSYSIWAGWLVALLFLTEPNLLAHSSLFTTDAISAFLVVISSILILNEYWQNKKQLAITSLLIGLSASSKVATLSLLAPLMLLKFHKLTFKKLLAISTLSILTIWSTYSFRLDLPIKIFPFPIPLGGYLRSIKENIQFAQRGHPLFFTETLFITGPWYKQFLVFIFKTPLPLLVLFLATRLYLLPLSFIFLVHSVVALHFGIRHLLPATIFLILSASRIKTNGFWQKALVVLLILLQFSSVYRHLPQLITYSNSLLPHPHQVFTDSDYDWGQGLISLENELHKRKITKYQLAYFGNVDPAQYLVNFQRIEDANPVGTRPIRRINPKLPKIISITCYYQCGYYKDPDFSINKAEIIAQSFLIFND